MTAASILAALAALPGGPTALATEPQTCPGEPQVTFCAERKLTVTTPEGKQVEHGHFGRDVGLSKDGMVAVIGDPRRQGETGAASIFHRLKVGTPQEEWAEEARLVVPKMAERSYLGRDVAISGDGKTAVIGAPGVGGEVGAAFVFTRVSEGHWSAPVELTAPAGQETGKGNFGRDVAISADGKTILVGAFTNGVTGREGGVLTGKPAGAVWAYQLGSGTWSAGHELPAPTGFAAEEAEFGRALALNENGEVAVVGAPGYESSIGGAFVFALSGSTWTAKAALRGANEEGGNGALGASVAISPDGHTVASGAPLSEQERGSAFVFREAAGTWGAGKKVMPKESEVRGAGHFGSGVALAEGSGLLLVGAVHDNFGAGAAWVFVSEASAFVQQGQKLIGKGEEGEGWFGDSVALSEDGSHALVGGLTDEGQVGSAWPFFRAGFEERLIEKEHKEEEEKREAEEKKKHEEERVAEEKVLKEHEQQRLKEKEEEERRNGNNNGNNSNTQNTGTNGGSNNGGGGGGNNGGNGGVLPEKVVGPPEQGKTANISSISGTVMYMVNGKWVTLTGTTQIPFGTEINAEHGHVTIEIMGPNGKIEKAEFFSGVFVLEMGKNGLVIARLVGGSNAVCSSTKKHKAGTRAAAAKHHSTTKVIRKLWANAHGTFETKGSYAAGAVQGTEWLTEDVCGGTLFKVVRDKVLVTETGGKHHKHELTTGQTIVVK